MPSVDFRRDPLVMVSKLETRHQEGGVLLGAPNEPTNVVKLLVLYDSYYTFDSKTQYMQYIAVQCKTRRTLQ